MTPLNNTPGLSSVINDLIFPTTPLIVLDIYLLDNSYTCLGCDAFKDFFSVQSIQYLYRATILFVYIDVPEVSVKSSQCDHEDSTRMTSKLGVTA